MRSRSLGFRLRIEIKESALNSMNEQTKTQVLRSVEKFRALGPDKLAKQELNLLRKYTVITNR